MNLNMYVFFSNIIYFCLLRDIDFFCSESRVRGTADKVALASRDDRRRFRRRLQ